MPFDKKIEEFPWLARETLWNPVLHWRRLADDTAQHCFVSDLIIRFKRKRKLPSSGQSGWSVLSSPFWIFRSHSCCGLVFVFSNQTNALSRPSSSTDISCCWPWLSLCSSWVLPIMAFLTGVWPSANIAGDLPSSLGFTLQSVTTSSISTWCT